MAVRPWVTPQAVKDYSERESVKKRGEEKLFIDISRAEMYVISYTNNRFDGDEYTDMPEAVITAVLLLAEAYAASGAEPAEHGGNYKSGSVDDYSFALADTSTVINNLGLASLLDEYIIAVPKNGVTMKMRKL